MYSIIGENQIPEDALNHSKYYKFTYDARDKIKKVEYIKYGKISKDNYYGASRIDIEYSKESEKHTYYDSNGELIANKEGYFAIVLYLNQTGIPEQVVYFGQHGNMIVDHQGISKIELKYDNSKRIIEKKFYDLSGNLTDHAILGVPIIQWKYDNKGNKIEERYIGEKGTLKERWYDNVAIIQWDYNNKGDLLEERNYDRFEILAGRKSDGAAIINHEYSYDDRGGYEVIKRYYDGQRELKENTIDGVSIILFQYDNKDHLLVKSCYGNDGKLRKSKSDGEYH
jgi:hypothetical protein